LAKSKRATSINIALVFCPVNEAIEVMFQKKNVYLRAKIIHYFEKSIKRENSFNSNTKNPLLLRKKVVSLQPLLFTNKKQLIQYESLRNRFHFNSRFV